MQHSYVRISYDGCPSWMCEKCGCDFQSTTAQRPCQAKVNMETELDGMAAYAEAISNPRRDDPSWPLPSFDAVDWAVAFVKLAREKPEIATDEATMLAWFANALMRGYDEAKRRR